MNNMSIRYKLLTIVISTIILVSVILTVKSIYELKTLTTNNIEEYKKRTFNEAIDQMKHYTAFALGIAKNAYEKSKIENIKANKGAYLKSQTDFLFTIITD